MASAVCALGGETNWVKAVDHFREVNGTTYNTERSVLWTNITADCTKVLPNGLVARMFTVKPVYELGVGSRPTHNYLGGVTGYRTVTTQVKTGEEKVPGKKIYLRNYPHQQTAAVGQQLTVRAMFVGTLKVDGEVIESWDCGTPHYVPVVK